MATIGEGTVIAGKYRLERILGSGGMGAVWLGRHLELDMPVAIKLMAPTAASKEWRARFKREARAVALLKSPHVVQVHDYGVEGDQPYLVMEVLQGEDLSARLKREGRLAPAATARILGELCKGLRRAHEVALVHRDLKPGNVFLARVDGEEVVKILDFGLAKSVASTAAGETETGTTLGTPHYMSPEQARDSKRADARSDLWSVGVIAFRCLTGSLPFKGDGIGRILVAICTDPLPVASEIAPDLGPAADRFFARALARDPSARFQTAAELSAALAELAGVTISDSTATSAPPLTPSKWRALLPWAVAMLGLVLLGLTPALPEAGTWPARILALALFLAALVVNRPPDFFRRRALLTLAGILVAWSVNGALAIVVPRGSSRLGAALEPVTPLCVFMALTLIARPGSAVARKVRIGILVLGAVLMLAAFAKGNPAGVLDP